VTIFPWRFFRRDFLGRFWNFLRRSGREREKQRPPNKKTTGGSSDRGSIEKNGGQAPVGKSGLSGGHTEKSSRKSNCAVMGVPLFFHAVG
jgi:hypothetical protein